MKFAVTWSGVFTGKAGLICSIGCCYTAPRRHILRHVKREGKAAVIGGEGRACSDWLSARTGPVKAGSKAFIRTMVEPLTCGCSCVTNPGYKQFISNLILCSSRCFGTKNYQHGGQNTVYWGCRMPFSQPFLTPKILRAQFLILILLDFNCF